MANVVVEPREISSTARRSVTCRRWLAGRPPTSPADIARRRGKGESASSQAMTELFPFRGRVRASHAALRRQRRDDAVDFYTNKLASTQLHMAVTRPRSGPV
jgi:hypothetical protein